MLSLGKFIRHQSQWNDKFQVHLQIHTAFGVKVSSSTAQFFVQFKRGDHKGSTMKLHSSEPNSIVFDSSSCFSFPCTLYYYDVAKKDYEEKIVTIYFNEDNLSDPNVESFVTLGKTNIDLSKYAKQVPLNSSKSFPLTEVLSKPKKGEAIRLQVTLTITCVLVNDPAKVEPPPSEPLPASSTPPHDVPQEQPTPNPPNPPEPAIPATESPLSSPSLSPRPPTAPIHIPASPSLARREGLGREGSNRGLARESSVPSVSGLSSLGREGSNRALRREASTSSVSGYGSFSKRSEDGESVSSFSSRNSPRNSPPSSPSSSPSSSPPRFSTSFEVGSNGSMGSGPLSANSLSSSSSIKSYLQSPPIRMHLLERQASDSFLNTSDIATRLASKHPELCKPKDGTSTPVPGTPTSSTPAPIATTPTTSIPAHLSTTPTPSTPPSASRMDPLRASSDHAFASPRVDSLRASSDHVWLRASSDQIWASPRSPHRRALDFKNEGRIKSTNELKSPMLQKAHQQKQKDDERYLIEEIIPLPPCYSNGIPVLAYVLFRALLRWRSFHPNNNQFIDSFFAAFSNLTNILPCDTGYIDILLYRFSTAVTLRHILHTELHVLSSDNVSTVLKDFSRRLKKTMWSFYELYYSKVKEDLDLATQSILENVKDGKAEIVTPVFAKHLELISSSILFESLQHQIIYQVFYYFNSRMLNSLLQRTTPCQCAVGLGMKMLVLHIENWASAQNEQPLSQSGDVVQLQSDSMLGWVYNTCRKALSGMRQAADVLVVTKSTLIEPKIRAEVCPALTPQQLLTLLESYVPDEFDPEPMHPGVIKSINDELPSENSTYQNPTKSPSSSTLDASSPSSLDTHFTQTLTLNSLSIPSSIINHPSFSFLRDVCTDSNSQW